MFLRLGGNLHVLSMKSLLFEEPCWVRQCSQIQLYATTHELLLSIVFDVGFNWSSPSWYGHKELRWSLHLIRGKDKRFWRVLADTPALARCMEDLLLRLALWKKAAASSHEYATDFTIAKSLSTYLTLTETSTFKTSMLKRDGLRRLS